MTINPEVPFLDGKGELATPTVLAQIDARAKTVAGWSKGALNDRSLNAVVTPGTYWQSTAAFATVERGYPRDGMTLVLRVEQAATDAVTQEAIHYDSAGVQGVWRRTVYTDGRATKWEPPVGVPKALEDSNLGTVRVPGTYWQSTASLATTARGYPKQGMLGVLEVHMAATSIVTQTYTHYDSTGVKGVWKRTVYSDGRVTEWTQDTGTPKALVDTNLNTVTAPGPYWQSTPSLATVERGYPRNGMTCTLDVRQAGASIVLQELTHYDSTGVRGTYRRLAYEDGRVTDWVQTGTPAPLGTSELSSATKPGSYYQALPANATIARGYPRDGMTCTLEVRQAATSIVLQELTHYDSTGVRAVYRRTVYTDGRATEWTQTSGAGAGPGAGSQPAPVVPSASPKQSSRRGPVILRFDDGFNGLVHAAEYMAQYGLVGYHAACSALTPHDSIRALHTTYGWEIGNHVAGHESEGTPTFLARVDEGSRGIADLVGEYPMTFTYPRGHRSPEGDREMALRFNQVQLTSEPHTSAVSLAEPSFFSGWTVVDGLAEPDVHARAMERMKRYVVGSTSQGLVPTLAFHEVAKPGETPASSGTVSWELFTSWIDWLASEGFETILPRMLRPAQLVVDPGFNAYQVATFATGAYPWASSSLSIWSRSTSHQYSGLGCLRAASSTPVTGTVSQGLALEPGREYRVHVLADVAPTAGAVEVELRPRLMDGRYVGATIPLVKITTNTGGFKDHTMTFTMPSGTQNASLFVKAEGFAGTAVVDHVSIMRADLHDPLDPSKP
ncbi:hypothetical protein [Micrococcus luteus]|uniref:hypothetical protein n=1 Tax=Micrococcus luteus TaxID=1270 RepID=UPI003D3474F8